jgi:GntR family transcriptional repressor for pyruvate dehydrogenase complex
MAQPVFSLIRLERSRLVPQVVERLRAYILTVASQGKEALPSEGELARTLGVSRTVLREAMKQLQAQGLVAMSQGKKPRVRPADPQTAVDSLDLLLQRTPRSLRHLVEVRRPLECEIAALAAERATPQHLEAAAAAIDALRSARSLEEQVEADVRFHRLLAEATANPVFLTLLDTVSGLLRESRRRTIGRHGMGVADDHHREILEAIRRRDPAAARAAMAHHLDVNAQHLSEEAP